MHTLNKINTLIKYIKSNAYAIALLIKSFMHYCNLDGIHQIYTKRLL